MEKTIGEMLTEPENGEDDREKRRRSLGMEKTTGETLTAVEVVNGATGEDVVERERQGETTTELGIGEDDGGDADDSRGEIVTELENGEDDGEDAAGGRKYRGGRRMRSRTGEGDEQTRMELVGCESVGRESIRREQMRQELLGMISSVLAVASR
ncbi:hypothetical protein ACLOJK_026110 [Asimina triloba]